MSVKKTEEGLYELLYNGRVLKVGKDFEIGRFIRNSFYLGVKDKDLLPAFAQLSKEIISKVGKRELRQQYNDLDKLYEAAKKANEELVEMTKKVAKETNGKAGVRPKEINNGLKGRERALEKINSDYINPETKEPEANLLVDIAGSKIVYDKLSNLYKALEKVNKEYKILRIKDRIQTPVDSGYRDILMNLEMKNGHIVEFRLHLKEIDEVAANGGHKLYQQRRTLDAISTQRGSLPRTDVEIKNIGNLGKLLFKDVENVSCLPSVCTRIRTLAAARLYHVTFSFKLHSLRLYYLLFL